MEGRSSAPGLVLGALDAAAGPAPPGSAVTAFVGVAERGPLHRPQAVRSFGEFADVFGGFWEHGALAESVYAFFLNGGEEARVVRVGGPLPAATQQPLAAARSAAPLRDANGDEALRLSARSEGAWGNRLAATLFAESGRELALGKLRSSAASGATEVEVDFVHDYRVGGTVHLVHRDNPFARSTHEIKAIDGGAGRLALKPALSRELPKGSSVSAQGFGLEVTDGVHAELFDGLSMNPAHPRYVVDVLGGPAALSVLEAARAGHSLLVTAERVLGPDGAPRFRPASPTEPIPFAGGGDGVVFAAGVMNDAGGRPVLRAVALPEGRRGNGLRLAAAPFTGRLALAAVAGATQLVLEDIRGWSAGDEVTFAGSETRRIASVEPDEHLLMLTSALANDHPLGSQVSVANRFNLLVELEGELPERFFNLSMAAGPRFAPDVVGGAADPLHRSRLVCLSAAAAPEPGAEANPPASGTVTLGGGADPEELPLELVLGYDEDGGPAQIGSDPSPLGVATLEPVPEVNLISVPDLVYRRDLALPDMVRAQRQLLVHCERMGERFALLDMPRGLGAEDAFQWPAHFFDSGPGRFGALYYPWLETAFSGASRWSPPSGAVAGLIAQADRQEGVGRPPANLAFKGIVSLEREIEAPEQAELNLRGVNCIRKFEVGAIRLWGARTLSSAESQTYVHQRRVVLMAMKALSSGLRWAVFEPNDAKLRQRIKGSIEGLFRGFLARGLIAGDRPEDAFYVDVGEPLNGPETPEGQVLAEVGVALSRPAEFIVLSVRRRSEILRLVEEET